MLDNNKLAVCLCSFHATTFSRFLNKQKHAYYGLYIVNPKRQRTKATATQKDVKFLSRSLELVYLIQTI